MTSGRVRTATWTLLLLGGLAAAGSYGPSPDAVGLPLRGTASLTAAQQVAATSLPLLGKTVAVDPGHNLGNFSHPSQIARQVFVGNGYKACNTTGTSTDAGYRESRFTLAVAKELRKDLRALGATVLLTRTEEDRTSYGPCVDARGRFGAEVHADLLLSIHGDGAAGSAHGFHVIRPGRVPGYTDDIASDSRVLARAVRSGLSSAGLSYADYIGSSGMDVRTDLGTLNMSDVPAAMVELGNMRNAADAARMSSSSGQARYAAALASGVSAFLDGVRPRVEGSPRLSGNSVYARLRGGTLGRFAVHDGLLVGKEDLGRRSASSPGVAPYAGGTAVAVRGTDDAVHVRLLRSDGSRTRWHDLGGVTHSAPAVATAPDGSLLVVRRDTRGALRARSVDGTLEGAGWSRVPGATSHAAPVAAAIRGADGDGVDVTAVGADGEAVVHRLTADGWAPARSLGGHTRSAVGVASDPADGTEVFASRGLDGRVHVHRHGHWVVLRGRSADAPAVGHRRGALVLAVRRADDGYWSRSRTAEGWTSWRRG